MQKILLDTHVLVWMTTEKEKLSEAVQNIVLAFAAEHRMLISAITLWEIAMLVQKKRLQFSIPIKQWIKQMLTTPGLVVAPLTPEILIESCTLPGEVHGDPADQMIIATARIENATLVTRDSRLLAYAQKNHMPSIKV